MTACWNEFYLKGLGGERVSREGCLALPPRSGEMGGVFDWIVCVDG